MEEVNAVRNKTGIAEIFDSTRHFDVSEKEDPHCCGGSSAPLFVLWCSGGHVAKLYPGKNPSLQPSATAARTEVVVEEFDKIPKAGRRSWGKDEK